MQYPWPRALLALSFLSLLAVPTLSAQDDHDHDRPGGRMYVFGRPRIGVTVAIAADKEKDKIGARVQGVTPDGPADKAGLKEGDIITRFNGVALGGASSDDEDESGPGQKLIELARKLDAGDTVQVEYRRGDQSRKATLVAADLSPFAMRRFSVEVPEMREWVGPRFETMPGGMRLFMDRGGWNGLELTDLSPELGEYFGAKEGVLVLKAPNDSTLPLRPGDVILSIDGRAPKSESQVRRILGSYDGGESAKIEVLRKQRKVTLNWTVPQREETRVRVPRPRRLPAVERS